MTTLLLQLAAAGGTPNCTYAAVLAGVKAAPYLCSI
jgi:hypothetical protein